MEPLWPFVLSICFAVADWFGVGCNITWLRYVAKPMVLFALIAWLIILPFTVQENMWFVFALSFSLVGDIWLLAPSRFFLLGLGSFLFAQISYVIAFNRVLPDLSLGLIFLAAGILVLGLILYPLFHRGIRETPGARRLSAGASLYFLVLSLMLFSAVSTLLRNDWPFQAAACVAVGSFSFYFSDCLLAYDRFIRSVRNGRLLVHISYHLGQFGLILGVVLRTGNIWNGP